MTSIECLPPELLVRIFSFLDKWQLFDVEKVCLRFKCIVDEHVWSHLKCISAATVGYPDGDFVSNWMKVVHRVRSVQQVFSGMSPKATRRNKIPRMKKEVKKALMEVLKKLSRDAVFPLDFLQDVVIMEYPKKDRWTNAVPNVSEARKGVAKLMKRLELNSFEALHFNKLYVHGALNGDVYDPFVVNFKGRELPVPLDLNRITRMSIGCMRVFLSLEHCGSASAAKTLNSQFSGFLKLELIEVDKLELVYPAMLSDEHASVVVTLHFEAHRCQFDLDEFTSLLTILGTENPEPRNAKMKELLSEWTKKQCIRSSEIVLHSFEFHHLSRLLAQRAPPRDELDSNYGGLNIILSRVFPTLISKLHLEVYHVQKGEDRFLRLLEKHGVFQRLDEFCLSITDEKREEREDPMEEMDFWSSKEAVQRAKKMLRCLSGNVRHLERLQFDFSLGGEFCLSAIFEKIQVVGPLPRLLELSYRDMPCFPFIISVVQQAPNLRRLFVSSQHFEEERVGVQWIKQLLDSLDNSHELRTLTIRVVKDEYQHTKGFSIEEAKQSASMQRNKKYKELLADIERKIDHLLCILPRLHRVLVTIETSAFHVDANRNGRMRHPADKEDVDLDSSGCVSSVYPY